MDIEELKRLESEALATNGTVHEGPEWVKFTHALGLAFPAILAKLEAAQSSLEEIAMLADHQIPAYAFGDNEAACDLASRMSSIYKLAAFDKEQQ